MSGELCSPIPMAMPVPKRSTDAFIAYLIVFAGFA
jgi:hypothetical protein